MLVERNCLFLENLVGIDNEKNREKFFSAPRLDYSVHTGGLNATLTLESNLT